MVVIEKAGIKKVVSLEFFNSSIWRLAVDETKEHDYNPYADYGEIVDFKYNNKE